jgi:hypothetical protein
VIDIPPSRIGLLFVFRTFERISYGLVVQSEGTVDVNDFAPHTLDGQQAESLAAWLRLTLIPGVGGKTQRKLLKAFGLPEAIFAAGRATIAGVIGDKAASLLLDADNRASVEGPWPGPRAPTSICSPRRRRVSASAAADCRSTDAALRPRSPRSAQ